MQDNSSYVYVFVGGCVWQKKNIHMSMEFSFLWKVQKIIEQNKDKIWNGINVI